jgi:isopenicillin N synthase-like dioxygenase
VEVPRGQIIADSGDMLSRMTNDVVPATTHRVVTTSGTAPRHRYALPFFAHPRPECDLSVLPAFVSEDRPRRHPPITAAAFLSQRLREIGLVS